jgi:queuine tRNA-ribosyltransferase
MVRLPFTLAGESPGSGARAGELETRHGRVHTPVFMPVGTQATVKCQTVESLREAGASILLANTYHLMLRPGAEVFEKFGGIHRFMQWDQPVLTDSGGYQLFSMPESCQISEEGARFQSYIDGRWLLLSPETSIAMQKAIGSDIMMPLDQCIPSTASRPEAEAAMARTHRWAARSLAARGDSPQAIFGIVQGAAFPDLREASAAFLTSLPFDGFAVGGLAVGETRAEREDLTAAATACLPRLRPRYLMGVGTPVDVLEAVHRGVDMFDCIIPTSLAQRGTAYTSEGRLHMRRGWYRLQEEPLDGACACPTCRRYSRAYLHHLIKAEEALGWHLIGVHNLHFYHRIMREMREHVIAGDFVAYHREKRLEWARVDGESPGARRPKPRTVHPPRLGDYEVVIAAQGYGSIRQCSSGEVMHSVSNPMEEAHRLYVAQSGLADRLRTAEAPELVIWDVGLGAATNAMAAVRCWEELQQVVGSPRPLRLVSFERDLDPLRLAVRQSARFPHLHHAAPSTVLRESAWRHASGGLQWELLAGDFRERLAAAPRPDLIFYDPFSYKTDGPLWTAGLFAQLFQAAAGGPSLLFTYTTSTAIRAALLWAGFYVARGAPTGPKTETTVACTDPRCLAGQGVPPLLDRRWLERWERSGARYPSDVTEAAREGFDARVRAHPQFAIATATSEAP